MYIKNISLINFRCFNNFFIEFSPQINILFGENAIGKTSILEGISCVSITKSFKTDCLNDLIKFGESFFLIKSTFENEINVDKYLFSFDNNKKRLQKNTFIYKRITDYIGENPTISFSLSDFYYFKNSSKDRLKIFDLLVCQVYKGSLETYNYYKKVVKYKNVLLKELSFQNNPKIKSLINTVDLQISKFGEKIMVYREQLIAELNKKLFSIHSFISGKNEKLVVYYNKSIASGNLIDELKNKFQCDLKRGFVSVGPHRDDVILKIDEKNVSNFCSQGQQKSAMLSIKIAMAEILSEKGKSKPIILLDDIFSDLDKNRQQNLISFIKGKFQCVITTSSISDIDRSLLQDVNIINLSERMNNYGK